MKKLFILIPTLILTLAFCGCGHEHTPVTDEAVAPTCTQTGLTEGSHCSECGEVIIPQEEVEILDHRVAIDQEVAATCLATGLTEGSHCAVCNEVLVAQEETPITDHAVVTAEAVAPTCTAVGLTEGSVCSVCNQVFIPQEEIPMIEHTIVITPAVEATCSSTGLTEGSHCSTCNQVFSEQEEIPLTDHDKKIVKETASTCQKAGKRTFYCSGCNKETGSVELYKIAHKPVAIPATIATCTQNGLTEGSYCSVCKATVTPQIPTPKAEHKYMDGKCTVCDKSKPDSPEPIDLPTDTYEMNLLYGNVAYIKDMAPIDWASDKKFNTYLPTAGTTCYQKEITLFGLNGYAGVSTNGSKTSIKDTVLLVLSNTYIKDKYTYWKISQLDELNAVGSIWQVEMKAALEKLLDDLGNYTILAIKTTEFVSANKNQHPKLTDVYHSTDNGLKFFLDHYKKFTTFQANTDINQCINGASSAATMTVEAKGLAITITLTTRTFNGNCYGVMIVKTSPSA